jgi:hypothetical protein
MTTNAALEATLTRLEDQLNWYDQKSQDNQRLHKVSNIAQIVVAAAIPVLAWITPVWVVAVLGALIAAFKGLESAYQWEYNWINYRSTAERLKHEKFLFEANAGPYADDPNAQRVLAERVEGIVSHEHAAWITVRDERMKNRKQQE